MTSDLSDFKRNYQNGSAQRPVNGHSYNGYLYSYLWLCICFKPMKSQQHFFSFYLFADKIIIIIILIIILIIIIIIIIIIILLL